MTTAGVGGYRERQTPRQSRGNAQAHAARVNLMMLRIVGLVLVASLFLYISRMATIAAGSKSISALNAQIAAEESRRQQLEIALGERRNLDMIRDEAVTRLGMVRPEAEAVRVVSLAGETAPGGTQTVYDAAEEAETP